MRCALPFIVAALLAAAEVFAQVPQSRLATPRSVSAEVRVVVDNPRPTLSFRVVNLGSSRIPRGDLGVNTNSIWVLAPDGAVMVKNIVVDPPRPLSPPRGDDRRPTIAAGEEVVWELPAEFLIRPNDRPGVYRIYWDFSGTLSDELQLVRRPGLTLEGKPDPQPKTPPPRAAGAVVECLKRFHQAMDGNDDAPQFDLAMDEKNPLHREVALKLSQRARAVRELRTAITRHLGAEIVNADWPFEAAGQETLAAVDAADVTYSTHFKDAYVKPVGWDTTIHLRRNETAWTVSAENFIKDGKVEQSLVRAVQVLEETADEIREGRYASAIDAQDAMRTRIGDTLSHGLLRYGE